MRLQRCVASNFFLWLVEKAYSAVDSDSSVRSGRLAWPPWCFSRGEGYEPALGFTFSLPFIIISHSTTQLNDTNTYTYTHPNLNFFLYAIHILVPYILWSAQAVRETLSALIFDKILELLPAQKLKIQPFSDQTPSLTGTPSVPQSLNFIILTSL